ncbi:MAG: DUF370 domain-containing protein [Candidatus Aminicenantes bacterium]|nr:DUF370 domain-containing protein [Candidatus Aminicenantes bacterium]MCK5221497.1 DUF370 domain-containing protein [Candidatus Aminicenantes bacterium]
MSNKILLNIGFGNSVIVSKIVSIIQPNSAPVKRFVKKKESENLLIDATMGKKVRSVVVLADSITVLSAISVQALTARLENE